MLTKMRRLGMMVFIVLCLLIGFCSIYAGAENYEIRPYITLPEYRSDAARAIDAYERTMYRYMAVTEHSLTGVNADVKTMIQKLDSIDAKLTALTNRISHIEEALGIKTIIVAKPVVKDFTG